MTDSNTALTLIMNIAVFLVASLAIKYVVRSIKQYFDFDTFLAIQRADKIFGLLSIVLHIIVFTLLFIELFGDK